MLTFCSLLLSAVVATARPQPLPLPQGQPTELAPSVTVADFAASTKRVTGQATKVETDSGRVVTRIINQTVTTGRYRSSTKSPSLLKGKIAGIVLGVLVAIVIIIIIAVLIHKWRKRKTNHVCGEDQEPGDPVTEKKLDEDDGVEPQPQQQQQPVPNVPGQVGFASEPANPGPGPATGNTIETVKDAPK